MVGPAGHCGSDRDHIPHGMRVPFTEWRVSDLITLRFGRRNCLGSLTAGCGSWEPHPPHWAPRPREPYPRRRCAGYPQPPVGLAGFCEHGVGMLDECERCAKDHTVEIASPESAPCTDTGLGPG